MQCAKLHTLRLCATALSLAVFLNIGTSAASAASATSDTHALYPAPTTQFDSIASFANGDTVTLIETVNNEWSSIRLEDGTTGYCRSELLGKPEAENQNTATLTKTKTPANVYSAPEKSADILAHLPANAHISVIDPADNDFVMVQLPNGKFGYVRSDTVETIFEADVSVRTVPKLMANTGITTEAEAAEKLEELSAYFQNGRYWNCIGSTQSAENKFCITDSPCAHSSYGYDSCNIYTGGMVEPLGYYVGMQCLGYINLMSDLVFGTDAPLNMHGDFEEIRVGDHVRLVLWDHSMLVTDVGKDEKGKTCIYVTEVNADYETCQINWGRRFTQDDLRRLGDYVEVYTRYPIENAEQTVEITLE